MSEHITTAKLVLHIETNKGRTIHKEFANYAELFDYGAIALSDLPGGGEGIPGGYEMYTHTDKQWATRGENYKDFSDGSGANDG